MVALCYQSMQSAQVYARAIIDDDVPGLIKTDFLHISAAMTAPLERIDKRIPNCNKEQFNSQLKQQDPIRLENIKSMYVRLLPEKQVMAEILMEGLLKGEVEIDCTEKIK